MDRPEGLKIAVGIGIALIVGGLLGLSMIPRAESASAKSAASVQLYGRTLPSDETLETALGWIAERLGGGVTLELPDGKTRSVGYDALGVEIDRARLKQLLTDAADLTSPLSRHRRQSDRTGPIDLILPLRLDPTRALP